MSNFTLIQISRGAVQVGVLALSATLLLAAGTCKRNEPKPVTKDGRGSVSLDSSETPDPVGGYNDGAPNLVAPGTLTLEEIGEADSLMGEATVAEARALIEAKLDQSVDAADRYLAVDGLIVAPWHLARELYEIAVLDNEPQVVLLALQGLSAHGDATVQETLLKFVDWGDLWGRSDKHPPAYRPRQTYDYTHTPLEALARLKDPAVEPIIRELLGDEEFPVNALQGIRLSGMYGAKHFEEELAELFNNAESNTSQMQAAKVFLEAGINKDAAERVIRRGFSGTLAAPIIATAIARDNNLLEWEADIRKLITNSPDPTTRGQALEALGMMGLPLSDTELQIVFTDFDARGRLFEKLHLWADPARVRPLLEANTSPDDQDYYIVQLGLARLGSTQALETMKASAQEKTSGGEYSRKAIVAFNALAEIDDAAIGPYLMEALNDPDRPSRMHYAALQGLGRLQMKEALPTLVRFMRNYTAAQPGLAAYAASIAAGLAEHSEDLVEDPKDRLIWPLPNLGRLKALYADEH